VRRLVAVAFVLGALGAGTPARGASEAVEQSALAQAADRHVPAAATLRARTWNAENVRHLARWASGDLAAASPDEITMLRDELRQPISLSVAGAVSLGSYQGGFLYYLLAALKAARKLGERSGRALHETWVPAEQGSPLSLITGASSGSINAFIAAIASCQVPVPDPRQSLFWRVWFPVGGDALLAKADVRPNGLLSVRPIGDAVKVVEQAWSSKAWDPQERCAVDVGLSATRMRARYVAPLDDVDLQLPVQAEKLMFRMRGAAGQRPQLTPFVPPAQDGRDGLLRKLFRQIGRPGQPLDLVDVTEALRASSAFSLAFPPRWLQLSSREKTDDQLDAEWFTDGGVFDNIPVGLAVEMQRWRVLLDGAHDPALQTRYIVQDPDVVLKPKPAPVAGAPAGKPQPAPSVPLGSQPDDQPLVDTWLPFVGDFANSAFDVELVDALEREPTLLPGLEIPPRRVPVAGSYLMEFLAFAERDFRAFDFFTGMVDAWQDLAESSLAFQVLLATGTGPTFANAPEFDCLRTWRAHQLMNASAPQSLACAAMASHTGRDDELLGTNLEALVKASAATTVWRTQHPGHPDPPGVDELRVFLQALGAAPVPYRYRDLKYRGVPATAGTVDLAIRDNLQIVVERTTFNQPDGLGRFAVGGAGKALLNYYVYRPPSVYVGGAILSNWGAEVDGGWRLPWNRWRPPFLDLGLDVALRVVDIHRAPEGTQAEGSRPLAFTYQAAGHLVNELQLQGSNPNLQSAAQVHFGFGWAVESLQTWNGPLLWRHGPEALAGFTLFQRLTLDILVNYFRDDCAGNNQCSHAAPFLGAQLPPIVDSNWAVKFAVGYRFFMD
jgi:predicted acylesterase/phospholipase RssA